KAGRQTGDVIRKVNGREIIASGDLPPMIGQATPGEKVTLEVWRQGQRKELTAQLGSAAEASNRTAAADDHIDKGKLGLELRPLQPQERREAGVDGGLLVESVGGAAAQAGLRARDV